MNINQLLAWALPFAAALHVTEEFAAPGGFARWYAAYRPDLAKSMTTPFFVRINALMIAAAIYCTYIDRTGRITWEWFMMAGIFISNAIFHIKGAVKTGNYCPGLCTSIFIYIPLGLTGIAVYLRAGQNPFALTALLSGPIYHIYSQWDHKRRSA
jgi:hypothetical protein